MARPSKKSLANLRQAPPAEKGNGRALKHGLGATVTLAPQAEAIREVLATQAPVRAADGSLPVYDEAIVMQTARVMARVQSATDFVDEHGFLDANGELRPVVPELTRIERQLTELLDRLGMTPTSRARLGLNLARTADLATAMSEPDPEKRRAMLADVGLAVDGTAEEVSDE